ncbi:MAG TPA: hypothetical protein VGG64_22940 [Pirellulales bacterium]|jgi:hypothetical protein
MAGSNKDEFPPLLPDGFHVMTASELRALAVDEKRFPGSSSRAALMGRLEHIIAVLREKRIDGELWIDGSFLTEKIDPDDIDISLRIQAAAYDNGSPDQVQTIDWMTGLWQTDSIDGYLHLEWPIGHPNHSVGLGNFEYWKRQWGRGRNGTPKGIVVVNLALGEP